MRTPFSLARRTFYPWLFAGTSSAFGVAVYFLPEQPLSPELLLSLFGSIAAFFHFLYAQHNSNTDRFTSLFKDFNCRYDQLNERLNALAMQNSDGMLKSDELQCLFDYFNLCAEEYLYFKAGYIDGVVWDSWARGMSHFASTPQIRRIWENELKQGSYYGFSLSLLPRPNTSASHGNPIKHSP